MSLNLVPAGKELPEDIYVVIEIPQNADPIKYEIDKETGIIALDRVLHTAQTYPFDYGFVPQTLWDDGDALDVVLLTTNPLMPGIPIVATDDDPTKRGSRIHGVRVAGSTDDIVDLVDKHNIDQIVVAIPSSTPEERKRRALFLKRAIATGVSLVLLALIFALF